MANEQNLKPSGYKLSREEAKKGGLNSVKSRRRKKTMKELAMMIGNSSLESEKMKSVLKNLGIEDVEDLTNNAGIMAVLFKKAISGDLKAITEWLELFGEKKTSIELSGEVKTDTNPLDDLKVEELRELIQIKKKDGERKDS